MSSMHRPAVSVILAARNAAATISQCLDSVFAQTFTDFEVVVCDDCSTDATAEIVRSCSDKRVRLLENAACIGAGRSRDRAIESSTGEWLAVIDADDAWLPDRLLRLRELTAGNFRSIAFDDLFLCHDSPTGLRPFRRVHGRNGFGNNGKAARVATSAYLSGRRLVAQPLFSRELLQKSSASHDTRKSGQDLDFRFSLLAGGGELYYLPEPFYLYRMTAGSLSSRSSGASYIKIFEDARALFAEQPVVARALDCKIKRMHDKAKLVEQLRNGPWLKAILFAARNPAALHDLALNTCELAIYESSRRLHRAPAR